MLSDISKTFDPLGWLSPKTIVLKQLMQQPWKTKIDWEDKLPHDLVSIYFSWRSQLVSLKEIKLNEVSLINGFSDKTQLHVFSDASEKACAACVYIVAADFLGRRQSSLLAAKTKVAPLKTLSIPRSELCAALLGFGLQKSTLKPLQHLSIIIDSTHGWTASTIVLCWLSRKANHWSTFVDNSNSELQSEPQLSWQHVILAENPADSASRGLEPKLMQSCDIW